MSESTSSIIYLSPTRAIYQNEKVAQGLAGMTQWLFPEDATERKVLRRIWSSRLAAIDPQVQIHLLSSDNKLRNAMRSDHIVTEWVDGEFLTSPSATINSVNCPEAEWKVRILHPRKGNTHSGDWVYLSLALKETIAKGWKDWKSVRAIDKNTDRHVSEIVVPVIYPADKWSGEYLRRWYSQSRRVPPLTAMHREYHDQMNKISQGIQATEARLRNTKDGPTMLRLSQQHAQAIKQHEDRLRTYKGKKHKLKTDYQKNLWDIAKQEHIYNRLVLERGWKAMMIAGMQVMQLAITLEDMK